MSEADLRAFPLLADLEDAERSAVGSVLEELRLEPGTVLFEEGEQSEGLLFVAEGGVCIGSSRDADRVELGPGASLGAFSLVAGGSRETRAETSSRSRILVLRRSTYRRLSQEEPRAACGLLEAILRETASLSRSALGPAGGHVDPRESDD